MTLFSFLPLSLSLFLLLFPWPFAAYCLSVKNTYMPVSGAVRCVERSSRGRCGGGQIARLEPNVGIYNTHCLHNPDHHE